MNLKHLIHLLFVAMFFMLSTNAKAQNPTSSKRESYTVRITVTDSLSKETIIGAAIQLKSLGISAVTDMNGVATLQNVPRGQAIIDVSCLGYESVVRRENVTANISLNVRMIETSLQLKEVSVVAKKSAAGDATSSTIGRQAIEHMQATNLGDLMQLLPGATMQTPDLTRANTLQIRSASTAVDQNNSFGTSIIVDGVPVSNNANISSNLGGNNNTAGSGVDLRQISADNIESVEVIRGIPSAEYGDLTAGAVIVNSKSGKTPFEIRNKVNPTTINTSMSKGFAFGKKGGFLNSSFDYAQAWGDPRRKTESFDRYSLSLNYSNTFSKIWRVNTKFSYSGLLDWAGNDPDATIEGTVTTQRNNSFRISHDGRIALNLPFMRTLSYTVGYSTTFSDSHRKTTVPNPTGFLPILNATETGYYDVLFATTPYIAGGGTKSNPQDIFVKLTNRFGFKLFNSWMHQISMGAEYRYEQNNAIGYYNDDPNRPLRPNSDGRPRPYFDIPAVTQISGFVEDKMNWKTFGMKTNLSVGLRYSLIQPGKEEMVYALSPRINGSIELAKNVDLRFGYGQNAKTPGLNYLYPDKKYIDRVAARQLTLPEADRMAMYHSMVYDVKRSVGLKNAVNTKYELGIDIKLPENRSISVVAFHDLTPNGFGSATDYFTYLAEYYEIGKGLAYTPGSKPVRDFTTAPARVDTVFSTKGQFGNTQWSRNRGIEFDANLGRIEMLSTNLYVSAAFIESSSKTSGIEYRNPRLIPSNYNDVNTPPLKFEYEAGAQTSINYSFNSTFRAVTNIPALRMVLSNSVFVTWLTGESKTNVIRIPKAYVLANHQTGGVDRYEITQEMLDDPTYQVKGVFLQEGILSTADELPTRSIAPIWNIVTRLSKDISKNAGFSFFVNNTLFYEPWIASNNSTSLTQRNTGKFSFGMELYIKL